jgi:uncharacterized membrane protein
VFYLVYAAGIQVFVLPAGQGLWPMMALNGALSGLFTVSSARSRRLQATEG